MGIVPFRSHTYIHIFLQLVWSFSMTLIFLFPISGYICHGGWKEPLASQNTFSKVQDLKDQAHLPQYQQSTSRSLYGSSGLSTGRRGGGGAGSLESADHHLQYYMVISEAERPRQRICVRLVMDHDNSNVSLWANSRQCPPAASSATVAASNQPQYQLSNDRNDGLNQNNGQLWSFNLTRTSKWFAKKQE